MSDGERPREAAAGRRDLSVFYSGNFAQNILELNRRPEKHHTRPLHYGCEENERTQRACRNSGKCGYVKEKDRRRLQQPGGKGAFSIVGILHKTSLNSTADQRSTIRILEGCLTRGQIKDIPSLRDIPSNCSFLNLAKNIEFRLWGT